MTGASKGIGKGIARVFAGKGAQVLIASRDLAEAEAAAAQMRADGAAVTAVATIACRRVTPATRPKPRISANAGFAQQPQLKSRIKSPPFCAALATLKHGQQDCKETNARKQAEARSWRPDG